MSAPARVEPESGAVRARNVSLASTPATSSKEKKKRSKASRDDDESERRETVCTLVVNELDPRSIIQWPRLFLKSVLRTAQVFSSVRFIVLGDVIGGLVNTALLFTFAAVFSSAIFGEVGLTQYVALGTGCSLITTVILQFSFTVFSDVGINVAGPDVNPAIFIATMAGIAKATMLRNIEDATLESIVPTTSPTPQPVGTRRLSTPTITDSPTIDQTFDTGLDPEALLATVLTLIIMSSVFFGAFVYVLGRLKVSRAVQLVPGSVLAGFMASIGYLVIVKALKTAIPHEAFDDGPLQWDFWMYFLPSIPIGVAMYLQKRWHIGSPVVLLPIILIIPLIIFFGTVYGTGSDIEAARGAGWLFPAYSSERFYTQFIDSYGMSSKVDWRAVSSAIPTMLVMMFIVTVDSLLKQAAIRKLLKAHDLRIDHELMLLGKANIITGLLVGMCGYPQPKLVAINYGVLRNTSSRVSGMIILTCNAILFFLGFPLINYLPRFWLAGVLIFAASGFIVENLWDSRLKFSRKEYVSIWAIVIVNALFGLAWGVLCGIVLSALIFAMAYSRGGAIKAVISGSEYRSSVVRPNQDDMKLEHIGARAVIIQLHRYVFFGSAAYVNEVIIGLIKEQDTKVSEEKRATYFVFDWAHVEDVDVTAMDVVTEMLSKVLNVDSSGNAAHGHGHAAVATSVGHAPEESKRVVLFSGLNHRLRKKLADENIIQLLHEPEYRTMAGQSLTSADDMERGIVGKHRRCFETLDRGMEFVEEGLLQWSWEVRRRWFKFDSFRDFHLRARIMLARQSFEQVLATQLGEEIWRFVEPIQVPKGWTLCRAGDVDFHLYLVREGSLTAYIEQQGLDQDENDGFAQTARLQTLGQGAFVNEDAAYVDRPVVPYTVVADVDSVVLALSRDNLAKLDYLHPSVAIEVHRKVLKHAARTKHKIVRMLGSLDLWDKEETNAAVNGQLVEPTSDDTVNGSAAAMATNGTNSSLVEEGLLAPIQGPESVPAASPVLPEPSPSNSHSLLGALQGVTSSTFGAIQGVTATTFGALQDVTTGVAHTTVAALQTGLIVSGFREDKDDMGDKDLLDTTQLRDGAGEASGRRLAQQFTAKRRQRDNSTLGVPGDDSVREASPRIQRTKSSTIVTAETVKAVRTVREFRALKLGVSGDDGDDAINAIFNVLHSSFGAGTAPSLPVSLRMSEAQVVNAKTAFSKAAGVPLPRAPRGTLALHATSPSGSNLEMPRSSVREALAHVGLTIPSTDREYGDENDPIPVSETEFLRLVTRLSFVEVPQEFYQKAAAFFIALTQDPNGLLTEPILTEALVTQDVSPGSVVRFILKWATAGQQGVDFAGLCSALTQHVKSIQQDEQVEADWRQLSGGAEMVRAEDIARVFGCSMQQAQEMVWEADCDNNGVISFYDLLDTLTTFREGSTAWLGNGGGRVVAHSL